MMRANGLRLLVENLDREMSLFRRGRAGGDATALLASWARLVEFLGLELPPELRACPFCASIGVRTATRCGTCGRTLEPVAPPASA
jgi:hypothetical protein